MAYVRLFLTQVRSNGADALRNAVAPVPDRRFAPRTALGAAAQTAFALETSAGAAFVPGLQWPHRRLANALWAAVRPRGTHRVLERYSSGHPGRILAPPAAMVRAGNRSSDQPPRVRP
jgi:hypothetical protein